MAQVKEIAEELTDIVELARENTLFGQFLQSPVIDLAGVIRPKLSFNYFIDSTLEAEGGQLRFLDEAGEVLFTRQEIFSGQTDTWTPFVLTLPREVRDLKIIVEFRFLSDGDGAVGAGWYIDDVVVDG